MASDGPVSYSAIKTKLESYRAMQSAAVKLKLPKEKPEQSLSPSRALTSETKNGTKNSGVITPEPKEQPFSLLGKIVHSWRFQGFLTLFLWILAVWLEFGAVCFVLAALYWMWTWGTDKYTRPRDPNEPVIRAAFFYDPSPVPHIQLR